MIRIYGDSKPGLVRKLNEDSIGIIKDKNLFVLADGMGGYEGGQIASEIAVESTKAYVNENPFHSEDVKELILSANELILKRKENSPELSSMGTTMIAASLDKYDLYWAHVGDSRLYLFHNNQLKQITTDHSFVMELFNEGKISEEEMRMHPRKNEITRAVGIDSQIQVDFGHLPLEDDSIVLICSDGLSGMISDKDMEEKMVASPRNSQKDLDELGACLMNSAYEAGAKDNVSLILIQFLTAENEK